MTTVDQKIGAQPRMSRRELLGAAAAVGVLGGYGSALGQTFGIDAVLPLKTTGLEHVGITVADVERAGRFYGRIFNPELHREKESPLRYYVPFGTGYLAIGAASGRPTRIDHYCALVERFDRDAMARALEARGLKSGRVGMIPDPDELVLQLLGAPGGLAPSTVPAGRVTPELPLVAPLALEHVVVKVANLEESLAFYRMFFGHEMAMSDNTATVWFKVADTRLGVAVAAAEEDPCIDHFCVRVEPFDRDKLVDGLTELGARVEFAALEGRDIVRFRDLDGIAVELKPQEIEPEYGEWTWSPSAF